MSTSPRFFTVTLIVLLVSIISTSAHGNGTHSETIVTDHAGPVVLYGNGFRLGFEFSTPDAALLAAFGLYDDNADGLPGSYQVGLFLTSSQVLLDSVFVDSSSPLDTSLTILGGQYRYTSLATPIALAPNTSYTLATYFPSGSYFAPSGAVTLGTGFTHLNNRFSSDDPFGFPGSTTSIANGRGMVNAQLTSVPEPSSFVALVLCSGIGLCRRRRIS